MFMVGGFGCDLNGDFFFFFQGGSTKKVKKEKKRKNVIFLFFHLNPTVQITIVGERRRTEDLSEKLLGKNFKP